MPSPYLLHVNSRPKPDSGVDDEVWVKWYTTEHLPDLVKSGTSTKATFYRESFELASESSERSPRKFLAVYQTDYEECLTTPQYVNNVRHSSELFPKKVNRETGEFNARNYKLIQDYDPKGIGESPPPFMVSVEMDPIDEDDFNKWYHEEHLDMLAKLPGYRRSSRYIIGPDTPLTLDKPAKYFAMHEIDSLNGFQGKEAEAANVTPWTIKHIKDSKIFIVRAWEKIYSEGF